jgi:hypothetical protein
MLTVSLNNMAAAIIFFWSLWCIFSKGINDGVFGKVIFAFSALASFALLTGQHSQTGAAINPRDALNWSMAMLGVRHLAMRYWWPIVRRYFLPCDKCQARRAGDF